MNNLTPYSHAMMIIHRNNNLNGDLVDLSNLNLSNEVHNSVEDILYGLDTIRDFVHNPNFEDFLNFLRNDILRCELVLRYFPEFRNPLRQSSVTGETPLQIAYNSRDRVIDMEVLLHYADLWDPALHSELNIYLDSALFNGPYGPDYDMVRMLLNHGANPNAVVNENGYSIIDEFIYTHDYKMIGLLSEYGATFEVPKDLFD